MTDYYVDPVNGNNANDGRTVDTAWEDFSPVDSYGNPQTTLSDNDVLYVRGNGTVTSDTLDLRESGGSEGSPVLVTNYDGEEPVVDFSGNGGNGVNLSNTGYITIENIEFKNAAEHNITAQNGASNHVIRNCEIHGHGAGGNFGAGIEIRSGQNIIVENCELYDGSSGGNSDGFVGGDNSSGCVIRDTVAHHNSDDGFDVKGKKGTSPGTWKFVRCMAYRNGHNLDSSATGNGVGFKCGNEGAEDGPHEWIQCVAFDNDAYGWAGPTNENRLTFHNCAAVRNAKHGIYLDSGTTHEYTNCISQENGESDLNIENADVTTCNWDSGSGSFDADVYADFRSYDPSNTADFLHLQEGSRGIDEGTDVGLPYSGDAPDWGRYEYQGSTSSSGSSGSAVLRVYSNSAWKKAPARYYDGNQFVSL